MTTKVRLCNQTHFTTATSSSLTCWHTGWALINIVNTEAAAQRGSSEAAHTTRNYLTIWSL